MKKHILLNYFRLIRPQPAASTAVTIIIGYLIMMGSSNLIILFILFIIGVLGSIFGFVLNEYADVKVDEKSQYLKEKPLVKGTIPRNHALFIALLSCISVFIITIIFFRSIYSLVFVIIAFLSGLTYDMMGKKTPGSDVFIGIAGFFGCLFGASVVSINFTNLLYIISLSIFIFLVFCNILIGGVKDLSHDSLAGAKTLAIIMGVNIKNGKMMITKKFKFLLYTLYLIYIILVFLAVFQPDINFLKSGQYIILIFMVILILLVFIALYKFLNTSYFDRPKFYRLFAFIGAASYLLVPIILLPIIGLFTMFVLLVLPTLWVLICNLILYGKPMQPQL